MARTNLPTDTYMTSLESQLESTSDPQAGLDSALKELLVCTGADAGITALMLPGETQPRLISIQGITTISFDPQLLERSVVLTLQGQPPRRLLRKEVRAALPLPSTNGYQGAVLLFGRSELRGLECLYAWTDVIGNWAVRQRRASVEPDVTLLLRSRNTLRALFDHLPLSLYVIDSHYVLIALNKSRADRARLLPNQAVGTKCYRALFGRSSPCQECRVQESLQSAVSTYRNLHLQDWRKGQNEWEISTFPIPDPAGEAMQAIVLEVDVTEKKLLEASLVQSEKMAAVGQLAAGVAHEINNPLATILANTQILTRDLPQDPDLQESLELIQMAGNRANEVVTSLLGFSRQEEYKYQPLDINENIQKSVLLIQHEADKRGASLTLELAARLPRIYASSSHLQGVWTNLVLNALDAPGMEPLEVKITSRKFEGGVEVEIQDNGMGIPAAELERVFEPFYTTKGPGTGTGLGLSICQRAVRHHSGTISVASQPGEGTRFTIRLPRKPLQAIKAG